MSKQMDGWISAKDHENCTGVLIPVSNIKDCLVCLTCKKVFYEPKLEPPVNDQ